MPSRAAALFLALAVPILAVSCATAPFRAPSGATPGPEARAMRLGDYAFRLAQSRELSDGIVWESWRAVAPRRQDLHVVRIEAGAISGAGRWRAVALIGPDPDGDGPAEACLQDPLVTALASDALVLVNANGFSFLDPGGPEEPYFPYREGRAVDIYGVAARDGIPRSAAAAGAPSLRVDADGLVSVGNGAGAFQAVSGFGTLLADGRVVPDPGGARHPRSAAGVDREGALFLVVADGRNLARGPGLTLEELARIFADLGCVDALNLDGGGSSVLVLRGEDGSASVVNRPSDLGFPRFALRPVPVAFAIVPAP